MRNGWLDFKENSRVEKSARAQATCADCPAAQRAGRAVYELVGRRIAREDRGLEGRAFEDSCARRAMGEARGNFARSFCRGEKRGAPAQRAKSQFQRVRSAHGLGHGAF